MNTTLTQGRAWWIAIVAGMASFLDAAAIAGTGTGLLLFQEEFGFGADVYGQLSAILTFTVAVGALAGGFLSDRFGRRRVFTVTVAMFAIGAAILAVAPAVAALYLGILLIGLAAGADLPASMAMIAESAPEGSKGKMVAFSHILWMAGILAVVGIGVFVGGMGGAGARILYGILAAIAVLTILARIGLPESGEWQRAHTGAIVNAPRAEAPASGARALLAAGFVVPLIALSLFYAIANIPANTNGQFSAYLYVNAAGTDVSTANLYGLIGIGVSLVGNLTLMRLVDTKYRMIGFVIGLVLSIVGFLIPVIAGVNVATLVSMGVFYALGGAIAGEPMFKVWAQELFPTLHRSTAQGIAIAFTRVIAAIVALFTPIIITAGPSTMFVVLIVSTVIAGLIGLFWIPRLPRARSAEKAADTGTTPVVVH